jgi:hypothetical protein
MWAGAWVSARNGSVEREDVRSPPREHAGAGVGPVVELAHGQLDAPARLGRDGSLPLSAYDTVLIDTPAAFATSWIFAMSDSIV